MATVTPTRTFGTGKARARAKEAANSPWLGWLGRFGLAAQGASYAIVGVLALELAFGHGGKTTSRQGAFATLADESLGKVLLVLLAIGFVGYALWRFANAFFDRKGRGDGAKGLAKRAGDLGKGLIYAGLTYSVIKLLVTHHSSGGESQRKAAAGVLGWPAGKWIVLAAAAAVAIAALYNVYRGLSRKFEDQLHTGEMSHATRKWVGRLGTFGLCARGVVFGVIAWFLAKAALEYSARDAIGIGGALSKLAHATYGPWLLGATAAGLLAFGVFCLAQARYREV